jgi:hypothetical protein
MRNGDTGFGRYLRSIQALRLVDPMSPSQLLSPRSSQPRVDFDQDMLTCTYVGDSKEVVVIKGNEAVSNSAVPIYFEVKVLDASGCGNIAVGFVPTYHKASVELGCASASSKLHIIMQCT